MAFSRSLHNVGNVALINVHSVRILCNWLKFTSNLTGSSKNKVNVICTGTYNTIL